MAGLGFRDHGAEQIILLVDDEVVMREGLARHLGECGFTVIQAGDAEAALEFLNQPLSLVDLVFTDVLMPGRKDGRMDGLALARWVTENRPDVPVIVAGSDGAKTEAAENLCGAVNKPFDHAQVTEQIRAALRNRRPHHG
jgi:DNA-binding NtrC family response regulator